MKKEILILSLGIILIIVTAMVFLRANKNRQGIEEKITATLPLVSAKPKTAPVKIWFAQTAVGHYELFLDPAGQQADTLQLIFNTNGASVFDFLAAADSPFLLRYKSLANNQAILLFSTSGQPILIDKTRPLGEFILPPEINFDSLLLDPLRSKLILRGENFPLWLKKS